MKHQTIPLKYILEGDYPVPTPQRAFTWNKIWSQRTIQNILWNRPIGCLTVNLKGNSYEIIDGFKRIQSILFAFDSTNETKISVDISTGLIVDANIIGGFVFPLSQVIDSYGYVEILRKIEAIEDVVHRKVMQSKAREISSILLNYRIPLIEMANLKEIECYQIYRDLNVDRFTENQYNLDWKDWK